MKTFIDILIEWYNEDKEALREITDFVISKYWQKSEEEKCEIDKNRHPFLKEVYRELTGTDKKTKPFTRKT